MSGDAVKFLLQTQRIKPPWTTQLNTPQKLTAKRASIFKWFNFGISTTHSHNRTTSLSIINSTKGNLLLSSFPKAIDLSGCAVNSITGTKVKINMYGTTKNATLT